MKVQFELNGNKVEVEAERQATLLWVLRDHFNLSGTKYSCGIAQCGSCTVHIDGNPVRACVMPISAIQNKKITTIEGLGKENPHPLQKAWIAEQVPQCGYCQSGQIMQAAALLDKNPSPTREEILTHMNGVLCRCGAYMRIVKAIESVSQK